MCEICKALDKKSEKIYDSTSIVTQGNMKAANDLYEKSEAWKIGDNLLYGCFNGHPEHDSRDIVKLKIKLLNSLYGAGVWAVDKMAEHIVKLKEIGCWITLGDPNAVSKITQLKINEKKKVNLYVFATKYCHFHQPQEFPMCDNFVMRALKAINGKGRCGRFGYSNGALDEKCYKGFKLVIDRIKEHLLSLYCSYKYIDKYLWLYGQYLVWQRDERKIPRTTAQLFNENKELCEKLKPSFE